MLSERECGGPDRASDHARAKRRVPALLAVLCVTGLIAWFQWGAFCSAKDTYRTALDQLERMRADSNVIVSLRATPKAAAGRTRRNEELLAQVGDAMKTAGIIPAAWRDSVPQPVTRIPGSDYKRATTRLFLEGIDLRSLAAFAYHLHAADPTLHISGVNLINRRNEAPTYDVDVAVSYLIFAPSS